MATIQRFYVNPLADGTGDGTSVGLTGSTSAFASLKAGLIARFAVTPDLASADIIPKFSCFGAAADIFGLNFANYQFTTDDTRYVWIEGLPGYRHPGYYSTAHYRLAPTDFPAISVSNINCHVLFDGIQVVPTTALGNNPIALGFLNGGTASRLRVRNCVLHAVSTSGTPTGSAAITGTGTSARALYLWNTVISGRFFKGVQLQYVPAGGIFVAYNNTIVGFENSGLDGANAASGRLIWRNNRIAAPITPGACYQTTGAAAPVSSGNYSGDASSPQGASFQNKSFAWADAANYNFHLASADGFTGTDLSADANLAFADDIDGDPRVDWYAGFDEPLATPSGGATPLINGGLIYGSRR